MTESFYPINLPGKIPDNKLSFDLFIHFKGQYLCFRKAQTELPSALLDKLRSQKVSPLFVQSAKMDSYNDLIKSLLEQVLGKQANLTDAQRVDILSTSATSSLRQLTDNPKDPLAYNMTALSSKGMIDLLLRNPFALKAFFDDSMTEGEILIHSRNVAILAVALGRKMGLKIETLLNLAIAGLLHDVGIAKATEEERTMFKLPAESLNKDQRRLYRRHALRSEEVLRENELISPPVLELIGSHEFTLSDSPDMSLPAQVLSMANLFDKKVTIHKMGPLDAYKIIKVSEMGNFHFRMIAALGEVLKITLF